MNTYLVDGQPVRAETDRHAVKYYRAVLNRVPQRVEHEGEDREVLAICETSGLGIFCDDEPNEHFHSDAEGVYWLTSREHTRCSVEAA